VRKGSRYSQDAIKQSRPDSITREGKEGQKSGGRNVNPKLVDHVSGKPGLQNLQNQEKVHLSELSPIGEGGLFGKEGNLGGDGGGLSVKRGTRSFKKNAKGHPP